MLVKSEGRPTRLAIAVFLVILGSLLVELGLTRVFSFIMWYHFAFLVISLALAGVSAGAVSVYVIPALGRRERAESRMALAALIAGVAALGMVLATLNMRMTEQISLSMLFKIAFLCLSAALPFYFIGIASALAMREAGSRVSLVYGADLLGAAAACLAFVPLIDRLGAPATIVMGGIFCAGASLIFRPPRALRLGQLLHVAAVLALVLGGLWLERGGQLALRYAKGRERNDLTVRWNSFSRVAVWKYDSRNPISDSLSDNYSGPINVEQLVIDIDASAATQILEAPKQPGDLNFLHFDLTSLPFAALDEANTLVIGSGGGRDVLLALEFGARHVTAVEINPAIAELVRNDYAEFGGHLFARDDVDLVVLDGRSYIESHSGRFDLIMLSMVDTFAATNAGALCLTENLLYTREAFRSYLEHLEPDGILSLTRWVWDPPRESLRALSLAREALASLGVEDVSRHLVVASNNNVACTMISRTPLSDARLARLRERIEELALTTHYIPGTQESNAFVELATTSDLDAFYAGYPFVVTPTSDNNPFFFFTLPFTDVFRVLTMTEGRAQNIGVLILTVSGASVLLLTLLFIVGPLLIARRDALRQSPLPWGPFILYFCGLGIGFMMVEIPLIQSFILLLGQPSASLSVILFSLLAGAGLGSLWTLRWPPRGNSRALLVVGAILLLLLLNAAGLSSLWLHRAMGWPMAAKAGLVALLVLPVGFCLGMFFPAGLRLVGGADRRLVPWAIGLNAVASVLGSILALILGILTGFRETLLLGLIVYALALLALRRLERSDWAEQDDAIAREDAGDAATLSASP